MEHSHRTIGTKVLAADLGHVLGRTYDRNPQRLAEGLHVVVSYLDLGTASEVYLPPETDDDHAAIGLKRGMDALSERFTLAHALGHHMLNHRHGLQYAERDPQLYDKQEHQADVFAAHFLFGSEMAVAILEGEAAKLLGVHRVRIHRAACCVPVRMDV